MKEEIRRIIGSLRPLKIVFKPTPSFVSRMLRWQQCSSNGSDEGLTYLPSTGFEGYCSPVNKRWKIISHNNVVAERGY